MECHYGCLILYNYVGIISQAILSHHFPSYDIQMSVEFLISMQLCEKFTPEMIKLTNLRAKKSDSDQKELLFFPALMSYTQTPIMAGGKDDDADDDVAIIEEPFQFGWCLQCIHQYQYFSPRFIQLLILHLAFKPTLESENNDHDRRCTIWSTGIMWSDNCVNTLVELVNDSKCVILLMSSHEEYKYNMISVRRAVITDILSIQQECCPSLQPKEFIIDPTQLRHYPIDNPMELLLYDIDDIAVSVLNEKDGVTSSTKHKRVYPCKPLKTLLSLEYSRGENMSIFVGRNIKVRRAHDCHNSDNLIIINYISFCRSSN